MKRKLIKLFLIALVIFPSVQASSQESPRDDTMLNNLRRMRTKQQQEEVIVRKQSFVHVQNENYCTPVQEARQRLRDIEEGSDTDEAGNVTINAGHGEIDVTDNHGTVNSDINIQVINQGQERRCL